MSSIFDGLEASEVIRQFIDWMTEKVEQWEKAEETFLAEDGDKVVDFLHEFEFEKSSKKRAVIATRFHKSRVKRRAAKDIATKLKPLKNFAADASNRGYIKRLKKLEADLKSQEDHVYGERIYKPRAAKDGEEQ